MNSIYVVAKKLVCFSHTLYQLYNPETITLDPPDENQVYFCS